MLLNSQEKCTAIWQHKPAADEGTNCLGERMCGVVKRDSREEIQENKDQTRGQGERDITELKQKNMAICCVIWGLILLHCIRNG